MKILIVHNYYQHSGGEDRVFESECEILREFGHEVITYTVHNNSIGTMSKSALAKATIWNSNQYEILQQLIRDHEPDVMHVHNTLPIISPSIYYAAKAEKVAVVQTLHNFRITCLNGLFIRNGGVCEDCLGQALPWLGIMRSCYREDFAASVTLATMLGFHKLRRTYKEQVDVFIALSQFSRNKFVAAGIPSDKIIVKPNFVNDSGIGARAGGYALYVGRLSPEKGLDTLLEAWKYVDAGFSLKIVGDGPLRQYVKGVSMQLPHVEWLGLQSHESVIDLMKNAKLLVLPSIAYENFPVTVVEAFSTGLPALVSGHGAMAEVVGHLETGLHFEPGNSKSLKQQVDWVLNNPGSVTEMGITARAEYEAKYTASQNYEMLINIYQKALDAVRK